MWVKSNRTQYIQTGLRFYLGFQKVDGHSTAKSPSKEFFPHWTWRSSTGCQRKVDRPRTDTAIPPASLRQDAEECIFLRGIWLAAARRGDAGRFMIVENGCLSLCAFGMLGGWGVKPDYQWHSWPWSLSEFTAEAETATAANTAVGC